jgi:hypothetical protein
MALKDAIMILVALALPIWLLVEQAIWWASSKESEAELDGVSLPVEPTTKKERAAARPRPMLPPFPRRAA